MTRRSKQVQLGSPLTVSVGWLAVLAVGCSPLSVGEACDRLMKTICDRAAVCLGWPASEVGACVSSGVAECCVGTGCQAPVKDPTAVEKCAAASRGQDCSAWRASAAQTAPVPIPGVCVGVAQPR